ncbi:MAG TPA: 4,5-dihydroxyphthalate decarboxylase [Alphaproteobacteria bacterium]|jgi:4,5-dihydroxyphthalate decarboxylase|nr:4,5-dihydroxyphthalate decarboxylase [Alphaproteobacteria bacterium]HJM48220.1 4,5-dihydroxyphthalate decarboxylase [Alphaproteobacteria bacterium]
MSTPGNPLRLTLATDDYDHMRDLASGQVRAPGVEITHLRLSVEEIFYRFTAYGEWDVSEYSFAKYVSRRGQGDHSITAIPVFPSRVFRLSSFYVRDDDSVNTLEDLRGRSVGVPEWSVTAGVYARGYLEHEAGVALTKIDWVQAGMNEPGREEKAELALPDGIRYRGQPDRSLTEMLLAGDIDAMIVPRPPAHFAEGRPGMRRLLADFRAAEEAHYSKTGIFPIMHTIAIRTALLERHPWIAANLMTAFEEAKQRSLARALDATMSHFPVPWGFDDAARAQALFGADIWPYGIEPNRPTLEAFLQYAFEQGLVPEPLAVEDLFPASVQQSHIV